MRKYFENPVYFWLTNDFPDAALPIIFQFLESLEIGLWGQLDSQLKNYILNSPQMSM